MKERNALIRSLCAILCVFALALAVLPGLSAAIDLPILPLDPFGKPVVRGDINCDGKINSRDIILVMQKCLDAVPENVVFEKRAADANGDGKINSRDVIAIMKLALA